MLQVMCNKDGARVCDGSCGHPDCITAKAPKITFVCGCPAHDALTKLALYFTSGNDVPVERATILATDFWRITGMTPNAQVKGPFGPEENSHD